MPLAGCRDPGGRVIAAIGFAVFAAGALSRLSLPPLILSPWMALPLLATDTSTKRPTPATYRGDMLRKPADGSTEHPLALGRKMLIRAIAKMEGDGVIRIKPERFCEIKNRAIVILEEAVVHHA